MAPVAADPSAPLFSLSVDEGAGMLIGMAAGDALGDRDGHGRYSAPTQLATVLAYHLMDTGRAERVGLEGAILAFAGADLLRRPDDGLREWLAGARLGSPVPVVHTGCGTAAWVAPLGLWYRDEPALLPEAVVAAAGIMLGNGVGVAEALAVAAAVAASTFGQSGADLVLGAAETVEGAGPVLAAAGLDTAGAETVATVLRVLAPMAVAPGAEVAAAGPLLGGIAAGASRAASAADVVVEAGRVAGSCAASVAGAVVGARTGLVRWPWLVANDTWFAELGRRLVAGSRETRDLPIPRAVEEHLAVGTPFIPGT